MTALIRLQNVWKTYTMGEVEVHAIRNLTLEVNQGDFLAIVGSSGSGKSTLMQLVGALDLPTKGKIFLQGKDIAKLDESALAQVRGQLIGFIFQQFNLMPQLSALENVMLPMMFQNGRDEGRARKLLEQVGLGDRVLHKPSELSGGQQQRVAIARALINDPEVVLADEPTGNLDSATGAQVMQMIDSLHHQQKKTVILVTHDLNLVKHAHKVVYLKDGMIVGSKENHQHEKKGHKI